jgi:lipopolysaccharide transport system permease protein
MPDTITNPELRFWLVEANPFAAMLAIVRDPLLGTMPTATQYMNVGITSVLGIIVTAFFYGRLRNRIVYWL